MDGILFSSARWAGRPRSGRCWRTEHNSVNLHGRATIPCPTGAGNESRDGNGKLPATDTVRRRRDGQLRAICAEWMNYDFVVEDLAIRTCFSGQGPCVRARPEWLENNSLNLRKEYSIERSQSHLDPGCHACLTGRSHRLQEERSGATSDGDGPT